jgi:hypothetical protein
MKTHLIFLIPVLLLLCLGCEKHLPVEDKNLTYIYWDSLSEKNILMDHLDKCRFVKLQTTEDCLIKEIIKMELDGNKIFIKDKNEKVFVFDDKGNFLNTVGQIGGGPDEQLSIYDFYLDKQKKRITIFDMLKHTLFSYSYSGELMERQKVNGSIFKDFYMMYFTPDRHLILATDNNYESLYNYRVVGGNNYDEAKNYIPYFVFGEISMASGISTVSQSKEEVYLTAFLSDTIYQYDRFSKKIVPKIVFKGKYRPVRPKDVEGKTFETAGDALYIAKAKKLSYGISSICIANKYIQLIIPTYNEVYRVFWDMETQTGSYSTTAFNESLLNNYFSHLIAATDSAFVCTIPAYEAILYNWDENKKMKEIVSNTLEDDNPILIFYYLK